LGPVKPKGLQQFIDGLFRTATGGVDGELPDLPTYRCSSKDRVRAQALENPLC
jgi:hypothetical protein